MIEREYVETGMCLRALAAEHGVPLSTLSYHSSRYGWPARRQSFIEHQQSGAPEGQPLNDRKAGFNVRVADPDPLVERTERTDDEAIEAAEHYMARFREAFDKDRLPRDAVRDYDRMARLREFLLERREEKQKTAKRDDGLPNLEEIERAQEQHKDFDELLATLRQLGYDVLSPSGRTGDRRKWARPWDGAEVDLEEVLTPPRSAGVSWETCDPAQLWGDELRLWAQEVGQEAAIAWLFDGRSPGSFTGVGLAHLPVELKPDGPPVGERESGSEPETEVIWEVDPFE